jgi:hypothetical protein
MNRFVSIFTLCCTGCFGQAVNACDLNADGAVNIFDVQLAVNMVLGKTTCTAAVYGSGVCNVVVVQRVVNASLGKPCLTGRNPPPHSVTLTWVASASTGVVGYHCYRSTNLGGPYAKITMNIVSGTTYLDSNVQAGVTYYYVATAMDSAGAESIYSNQTSATIPTP